MKFGNKDSRSFELVVGEGSDLYQRPVQKS